MRVIAVINQKGGVGKTTTVANLGSAIAAAGHSICLIDLDPQAHLTLHYGIEPGEAQASVYDVLTNGAAIESAAVKVNDRLAVVPSTIDLAAAEVELVGTVGREQILRDQLRETSLPYEIAMIDCPPSLGLLTLNALAAADEVIIPLQAHFLALQGLGKLLETVALVQRRLNPALKVSGVVLCMFESNTKLSGEVLADLTQFFDSSRGAKSPWAETRIFQTAIRRNIKLAECPSYGKTIFDYEPNSRGAEDYAALAREFFSPLPQFVPAATEPAAAEPAADESTPVPTEAPAADTASATQPAINEPAPAAAESAPADESVATAPDASPAAPGAAPSQPQEPAAANPAAHAQ